MPSDGFGGFKYVVQKFHVTVPYAKLSSYTSPNYLNTSAPPYTYYVRKHNPLVIYDSVALNPSRAPLLRNFNDFAADLNASTIPQWLFVTPNLVNDGHDTNVTFIAGWLKFWLMPLLADPRFNDNGTLILLTFDENGNSKVNNQIYALLLGGAVPPASYGTVDSTYYTHYSAMSTVENNWQLNSLGRFDTNK
jgi:Phosphoesterase family